tara:strand:+ start:355 stop:720 length:366 start_codon:yes stop_codon:yes gene_type:complete
MTIANAIKKVTKAGFKVTQNGQRFSAKKEGINYLVEFCKNGSYDMITCIGVRHENDHSDSQSIKAIRAALRMEFKLTAYRHRMRRLVRGCRTNGKTPQAQNQEKISLLPQRTLNRNLPKRG